MIQRIQSVYLFTGALLLAFFVVFDVYWMALLAHAHEVLPWIAYVLAVGSGVMGFVAVFLYKTRQNQERVAAAAQWSCLLLVLLEVVGWGLVAFGSEALEQAPTPFTYLVLALPFGAYVLFSLGSRALRKDIELVRSMDRLR